LDVFLDPVFPPLGNQHSPPICLNWLPKAYEALRFRSIRRRYHEISVGTFICFDQALPKSSSNLREGEADVSHESKPSLRPAPVGKIGYRNLLWSLVCGYCVNLEVGRLAFIAGRIASLDNLVIQRSALDSDRDGLLNDDVAQRAKII
jgi:hypothetical protein